MADSTETTAGELQYGARVWLQYGDRTHYAGSELDGRHYPRLGATPVVVIITSPTGKTGTIHSGDEVQLRTTETFDVADDQVILGVWLAPALYYWSAGYAKQTLLITRPGGGAIRSGDAVLLVSKTSTDQKIGRQDDTVYLTSSKSFTTSFFIFDAQRAPELSTSWLPLDQIHATGGQSYDTYRGYSWASAQAAARVSLTLAQPLPPGKYQVLVQVYHKAREGAGIGSFRVLSSGRQIVWSDNKATWFPTYGWQRILLEFELTSQAEISFLYDAPASGQVWVGAISLSRGGPRPFYVIAHHKNTVDDLVRAVGDGANSVEFDITPEVDKDGKFKFWVHHGFPSNDGWVPLEDYLKAIIDKSLLKQVALLMFDIKPERVDSYQYGFQLASFVRDRGIPAAQVSLSAETADMAPEFYRGVAAAGYHAGRDVSLIKTAPTNGFNPAVWSDVGERIGATFFGLGVDSKDIFSAMRWWLDPVSYTANMRDRRRILKKVYFWTLDNDESMRKMLDLGCDGIIVNDPKTLLEVLREQPYARMFRLATPADSQFVVHGWE